MNTKLTGILALAAALFLSGCASMSEEECVTGDWAAIGYEDGSRGYTMEQFSNRRQACAKHGVAPDFRAYQEGRDEGLVRYCQPSRGYNLGVSGGRYNGVCDAALEEEFLDAYRIGHELYVLRRNVSDASSRIYAKESELERLETDMRAAEARLISDDEEITMQDRVLLLADLKDMAERKGELEAEIEMLIADRARHEQALAEYQQTVAAFGF